MTRAEYMRQWRAAHPDYDKRNWEARKEYMRKYMRAYRNGMKVAARIVPTIDNPPGWPTRDQLMAGR